MSNVIIFKDMAVYIITKKYKEAKENITEETARIVSAATNLIKAELFKRNYPTKYILQLMIDEKWLGPVKPSVIFEINYLFTVMSRKYKSVYSESCQAKNSNFSD